MEPIFIIVVCAVGIIALVVVVSVRGKKQRRKALFAKYGDPEIVDMIMEHRIWTTQTQEQLLDSLGHPADIDQKVLKTKVKEIWKYNQTGRNRFGLRITVENGTVVGWDHKD